MTVMVRWAPQASNSRVHEHTFLKTGNTQTMHNNTNIHIIIIIIIVIIMIIMIIMILIIMIISCFERARRPPTRGSTSVN